MKAKKIPAYVPVLWYVTTLLWTVTFSVNFSRMGPEEPLVWLQGAVVIVSLIAAVANAVRYRRAKEQEEN